jgi:hypothetical protein
MGPPMNTVLTILGGIALLTLIAVGSVWFVIWLLCKGMGMK